MSFQNSKKTIGHYSYYVSDKIGDGCSSDVFRGIDERTKELVSIKAVAKTTHKRNEQLEMARAEIKALKMLKGSQNVLQLKEVLETRNSMYIITELCEKGTLREALAQQRKFPEARAIKILQEIVQGYRAISQNKLIHRDIKPDNIFLGAEDAVRIGDFGFAIDAAECVAPCGENVGSPLYMSYEALTSNVYSFKSDLWAIGLTFLEMLTGKTPWKSKTENQLATELQSFKVQQVVAGKVSQISLAFLSRVLVKDVELRMGPEELFSYQFSLRPVSSNKERQSAQLSFNNSSIGITLSLPAENNANEATRQKGKSSGQSQPSTQEDHHSKRRSVVEIQEHKFLVEPKSKVSSSTLFPSPRFKEIIDKKVGSSMIVLQEGNRKKLSPMNATFEEKDKHQTSENKSSISLKNKYGVFDQRLTSKIQKQMLAQIQSQINYFRFLFKLGKRMHETLKTNDQHIRALKEFLLYMTHFKMGQIQKLDGLSFSKRLATLFQATPEYTNLIEVLRQYSQRYAKQEQKMGLGPLITAKQLPILMSYCLKVLYQNILKSQANAEELLRKKGLVFIAEDLMQLRRLYTLQAKGWRAFHQDSAITPLLEKTHEEANLRERWAALKPLIQESVIV